MSPYYIRTCYILSEFHLFLCPSHFSLYLCPRNIKSSIDLHQPSTTATVVKVRCGNKFNFKNKSL